jgi:hypothetical protein
VMVRGGARAAPLTKHNEQGHAKCEIATDSGGRR